MLLRARVVTTGGRAPRPPRRPPSRFTSAMLLVAACLALWASVPNIGQAVRAATADGVPGTFTALGLECVSHPGHESCLWSGRFDSADGTIRRTGVTLYGSGREGFEVDRSVAASDIGHGGRVYPPGGSREWIGTALLLVTGYGLLFVLARRHLMPPSRPRGPRGDRPSDPITPPGTEAIGATAGCSGPRPEPRSAVRAGAPAAR
ncbi:hypothetical protein [Streptomyces sp. ST2-7A]|uniref:hypothetical protein n=1 Tax=Streptomyces sp. ST2-7A TaxID=2907214 RepID=UPI001F3C2B29|nr:hypothetical protein [Streptomyces sp. ST2-7A]MCE7081989.1 hypothetical protein [Streptomyces sp. ST2-7A]